MTSNRADTANNESTFLEERRSHSEIFVGTALRRLKPTPQTKIFGHHWGGRPRPVGRLNSPPPANQTLAGRLVYPMHEISLVGLL